MYQSSDLFLLDDLLTELNTHALTHTKRQTCFILRGDYVGDQLWPNGNNMVNDSNGMGSIPAEIDEIAFFVACFGSQKKVEKERRHCSRMGKDKPLLGYHFVSAQPFGGIRVLTM